MERTRQGEFAWTDLYALDLDGQSAFYEGLFGWTHADVPIGDGAVYRTFSLGGRTVAAAHQMPPEMAANGVGSMWNLYIAVDDVDAKVARTLELGGSIAMPVTDVMGVARYAAIMDPTGAPVFLWHNTKPDLSTAYLEKGMLSWSDLMTRDPEKAADFFIRLLGWEVKMLDMPGEPYWQVVVHGDGQGGIMPMPEMVPAEVPSSWLEYFGTDDIDASVAKAEELGGTVTAGPTKVGTMLSFAVVTDPAGATFALLQPYGPA
jgi:hypothetical protein